MRPDKNYKTFMMQQAVSSSGSQNSLGPRIQQILDEQRSLAYAALDDLMTEAFQDVGFALAESDDELTRSIGGLSSYALRQICRHFASGDLSKWLASGADGDKSLYLRDFLNFSKLQTDELKVRYPRAFTKWTAAEDEALLSRYQQLAQEGKKIPWSRMAKEFERNPNAIQLRLGHLGVDLGSEAGRPRRQGGTAR